MKTTLTLFQKLILKFVRAYRGRPDARRAAISASRRAREEISLKDWSDAVFSANLAIAADPGYEQGYLMLAYASMHTGDTATAREALDRGSRLAPDNPWFWAYLGQLELAQDRWPQAEAAYRRALELKPDDPGWLTDLAFALQAQGTLQEAISLLEKAHELDQDNARVLVLLGSVCLRMGELAEAEQALRMAVAGDPSLASAHYYLGCAFVEAQRWREAAREARSALELEPDYPVFQDLLRVAESKLEQDKGGA